MAPKKLADSVWSPQMGWGRTAPSVSRVIKPLDVAGIEAAVMSGSAVIARGLGRSYGDAAQNAGGAVLDLATLNSIVWGEAGIVTVGAGLCLRDLINDAVPRGWFVPVTPGTSWVTIGGAIAADVHGKNHHRDGSFGAHVLRIGIVDGRGDRLDLTPSDERFWATIGGMGLTGIIIDATVQMIPIPGRHMTVSTRRTADFDSTVEALMSADSARYSVA
ncbi:MAG: FAD-binding oxidoreductase, partial [Actinomycetes bacterium]